MNWEMKKFPAYYAGVRQTYPNPVLGETSHSRSAVVGNLIFLSGLNGRDLFTGKVETNVLEEQMDIALDKLRLAMEQAGSSLSNVVADMIYTKHLKDYSRMRTAEVKYYQKHAPLLVEEPPASSFMSPPSVGEPECLVEIDAIGVISRDAPGCEVKKHPMYYLGVRQTYPNIGIGEAQFSRTVVVGNLIFLAGMAGRSPITGKVETDVIEDHVAIALGKLKVAMEEAGSSMNNIIKTVIYVKNLDDYSRIRKAEVEFYQHYAPLLVEEPPITMVIEGNLHPPHYLVEISALGVMSRDRPSWQVKKYPAYYGGVKFAYPHVALGQPMFSRSARVGNLIFCTSIGGQALDTFKITSNVLEEQMVIALDNIRMALEEAGGSMNNIVKTTILFKNIEDIPRIRTAELEYYQKHAPLLVEEPPARTLIQTNLHMPDSLIEMEAIGFASGQG